MGSGMEDDGGGVSVSMCVYVSARACSNENVTSGNLDQQLFSDEISD